VGRIVRNAGIYVRISRDREGLEAGVDRQEADCRALAEARGWEVADVYPDNDTSATDRKKVRKNYRRMLDDVREGRIGAIVSYSSSRLYRRVRELDELVDLLEERGVEVATVVSGQIDLGTADGRMIARILASVDQAEAERIAERTGRSKAELKKNGGWTGGGAPAYGYERVKDERGKVAKHRVIPAERKVIREAVRRVLADHPLNTVVRDLNARGVKPRRGDRWVPSRLRATLTSPFHAGLYPDGSPGSWPAIITTDERRLLLARFPRRSTGQKPARAYALSGLLVCSECGRRLLGSGGRYVCTARNGGCGRVRVASKHLDACVNQATLDHLRDVPEPEPSPPDVDDQDVDLAELRAVDARLLELREALGDPDKVLDLDAYNVARDELLRRKADAEARLRERPAPEPRMEFRKLIEELTPLEQNEELSAFISRITVHPAIRRGRGAEADIPDRVDITWRS
jgi:site-specific DNA recombinase